MINKKGKPKNQKNKMSKTTILQKGKGQYV